MISKVCGTLGATGLVGDAPEGKLFLHAGNAGANSISDIRSRAYSSPLLSAPSSSTTVHPAFSNIPLSLTTDAASASLVIHESTDAVRFSPRVENF